MTVAVIGAILIGEWFEAATVAFLFALALTLESCDRAVAIDGPCKHEVESTTLADDTTLAHIIRLVSDAQSRRAPAEQWVEGFAKIIRQNIALSLGVKALFVFLTFGGRTSLWAAIAADMGVSLVVIFNALRLLRTEPE